MTKVRFAEVSICKLKAAQGFQPVPAQAEACGYN
jgi:hypothetical protein